MPKVKKENQQMDFTVYALICEREVFVSKVKTGNEYQAYKDNVNGRKAESKDFCQRCEAAGALPKMYWLEDGRGTARHAYRYRLAWCRYFHEHGYKVIAFPGTLENMNDLDGDALTIYKVIEHTPEEQALSKLLVKDYRRAAHKKPSKQIITMHVKPKEYDAIKRNAKKSGLTVSRYCKNTALKGSIVTVDFAQLLRIHEYFAELTEAKQMLQMILLAYFQNGKYYPADLESIQSMVDMMLESQKRLFEGFSKCADEVQKLLPE